MILYVCQECFFAVRVFDDGATSGASLVGPLSPTWGAPHECPYCGEMRFMGHMESQLSGDLLRKLRVRDMEPTECYTALFGGGLPEDRHATLAEVTAAFLRSPVVSVSGRGLENTTRSVVDRLVLQDGTRIYLGACPQGAVAYRVAQRRLPA